MALCRMDEPICCDSDALDGCSLFSETTKITLDEQYPCIIYDRGCQYVYFLRSEEHTSELQSRFDLVCRLLLEKKNARISSILVEIILDIVNYIINVHCSYIII